MRFKTLIQSFAFASCAVFLGACSDDEEGFNYTTGEMIQPIADTIVVNENSVMELDTELSPNDKIVVKSDATGAEIYLDWGYAYEGMDEDGNMMSNKTKAFAKVVFDDKWDCGKWQIYAENGSERRSLGEATFVVVKTDLTKPLNSEQAFLGILSVAADGFQTGGIDFFDYYNKDLGEIVYTVSSALSGDNPDYNYSDVNFPLDSLSTGSYTLKIRRWNYNFSQDLGDFDYFKIALVDTLDITTDETGQYYIDFYLDEVKEGDQITVAYGTGKNANYKEKLDETVAEDPSRFNAETNIYRSYIPENKIYPGSDYSLSLTRNSRSIKLSGSKHLPEDAVVPE